MQFKLSCKTSHVRQDELFLQIYYVYDGIKLNQAEKIEFFSGEGERLKY